MAAAIRGNIWMKRNNKIFRDTLHTINGCLSLINIDIDFWTDYLSEGDRFQKLTFFRILMVCCRHRSNSWRWTKCLPLPGRGIRSFIVAMRREMCLGPLITVGFIYSRGYWIPCILVYDPHSSFPSTSLLPLIYFVPQYTSVPL